MKHLGERNLATHDLPDVGSDSLLVCIQFHTDIGYSNTGEGMGTQPWYRSRRTCIVFGLKGTVGVEPPVEGRAGSVLELIKWLLGVLSRRT